VVQRLTPALQGDRAVYERAAPEHWAALRRTALRAASHDLGPPEAIVAFWRFVARLANLGTRLRNQQILETVAAAAAVARWAKQFWKVSEECLPLWRLPSSSRPRSEQAVDAIVDALLQQSPSKAASAAWLCNAPEEFQFRTHARHPELSLPGDKELPCHEHQNVERPITTKLIRTCGDTLAGETSKSLPVSESGVAQSLRTVETHVISPLMQTGSFSAANECGKGTSSGQGSLKSSPANSQAARQQTSLAHRAMSDVQVRGQIQKGSDTHQVSDAFTVQQINACDLLGFNHLCLAWRMHPFLLTRMQPVTWTMRWIQKRIK